MGTLILAIIIILAAVVIPLMLTDIQRIFRLGMTVIGCVIGLAIGLYATIAVVGSNETGIVIRNFGASMPSGQIVARSGEQGPQSEILGPGWHFGYWPLLYTVTTIPVVTIEHGSLGFVEAKDGKPLEGGQIFAKAWSSPVDMLDPVKFLADGGQRGPQLTVLPPGTYRYNSYLHTIKEIKPLVVPPGSVAVIKSNTGDKPASVERGAAPAGDSVNGVILVEEGQRGILRKPLLPGAYYLNSAAYEATLVKTSNRVYTYQASVKRDANNAKDKARHGNGSDDWSVTVRSKDGFSFPIDVRVACAVQAEDAPHLVALLGDPDAVRKDDQEDEVLEIMESKVILPTIRAAMRNVAEGMNALEFVNARSRVEANARETVRTELEKYRVRVHEVLIGNIHLDATEAGAKLMTTQTDREVAINQQQLYAQQQQAEMKRAELVKATAEAERQKNLVEADFNIKVNESNAKAAVAQAKGEAESAIEKARGEAEAQILTGQARAKAYKAMVETLGQNQVAQLEMLRSIADGKIQPGVITPQILMGNQASPTDALAATMLRNAMPAPTK
jgi:uncharacterized membrane protein YqiK